MACFSYLLSQHDNADIEALQWLTACHCVSSAEGPEWSKMAADIAKTSTSTPDNPDKYALSEYTQHLDNSQ